MKVFCERKRELGNLTFCDSGNQKYNPVLSFNTLKRLVPFCLVDMYSDLCSIIALYIYLWFPWNIRDTRLSQEVLLSLSTSFSLYCFICILLCAAFFDLQYMLSLKAKYCFPSMNHKSQYSQNWILFPILKSANKGFRKPLQPGDIFFLLSGNKHALLPEAI